MNKTVIIERASDGRFAAYTDGTIDGFLAAGYGESVADTLEDFRVSIEEMNEIRTEEGNNTLHPKFDYINAKF